MNFGISEIAVIPVRKESNEQSEQITQILFGESFEIIETQKDWTFVKLTFDEYEGWINTETITVLNHEEYLKVKNAKKSYPSQLFTKIKNISTNEIINIPFGSTIPNIDKNNIFEIKNNKYELIEKLNKYSISDISTLAKQFLNAPYLWGGKNPFGIDCSGFSQIIFKTLNYDLPRDARDQVKLGNNVNFITDTKPGDLAFFDNADGDITHVGIILSPNKIVHASVKVRIDNIDQQGIYNIEKQKYTHKLRIIKRIL